jgi:hypothetical protein
MDGDVSISDRGGIGQVIDFDILVEGPQRDFEALDLTVGDMKDEEMIEALDAEAEGFFGLELLMADGTTRRDHAKVRQSLTLSRRA